jgi:hypothetical protein
VWKPESIAELRLSLDYFRTWKLDDIVSPADLFFQDPALFESVYPYRVKRGPRATDDPNAVGPIEEIDGTSLNVARSLVEAFDLALDYTLKGTRIGNVNFWLRGTYEPTLWLRTTAGSPRQNLAGLSGNALKFSGVTGLTVERGRWRTDWTTRYLGRYSPGPSPVILANQGAQYVSAQTCHDVSLSYRPSAAESLTLTLSALNVLNRAPAYDASSASYASPLVDPRMRRFMFSVTKVF